MHPVAFCIWVSEILYNDDYLYSTLHPHNPLYHCILSAEVFLKNNRAMYIYIVYK